MKTRWIRTNSGHAGRSGFILHCPKGEATKYVFTTYDGHLKEYGDSVGDLKEFADKLMTSHPDAELV